MATTRFPTPGVPVRQSAIVLTDESPDDFIGDRYIQPMATKPLKPYLAQPQQAVNWDAFNQHMENERAGTAPPTSRSAGRASSTVLPIATGPRVTSVAVRANRGVARANRGVATHVEPEPRPQPGLVGLAQLGIEMPAQAEDESRLSPEDRLKRRQDDSYRASMAMLEAVSSGADASQLARRQAQHLDALYAESEATSFVHQRGNARLKQENSTLPGASELEVITVDQRLKEIQDMPKDRP